MPHVSAKSYYRHSGVDKGTKGDKSKIMEFAKNFLRNLVLLGGIGLVLFIVFPDMMSQIFELYGALFGPGLVLLVIIVAALPRRNRR